MFKKMLALMLAASFSGVVSADEASLKKTIEATYPGIKIDNIVKTNYSGLYEVFMEGRIIYSDENFSFLIVEGRMVDPKNRRDITAERMQELNKIDFATLPLDQAIKVVKGDGSRKVAVFSDPDCPYCKKLEKESLANVTNVTIYTFLFPLDSLHPDATNKSKALWCAEDKAKAWDKWMQQGLLPASGTCETPIAALADLGRKLNVNSTPTLFFASGKRMLGAYPGDEVEKMLAEPAPAVKK